MFPLDKALGVAGLDDEKIGIFSQEGELLYIRDGQIFFQPYLRIEVAEAFEGKQQVGLKLLPLYVCLCSSGKEVLALRLHSRHGPNRRHLRTLLLLERIGR